MKAIQREITFQPRTQGAYLVTD
jgi:secondary thiamine-phosphate synthase enzyme